MTSFHLVLGVVCCTGAIAACGSSNPVDLGDSSGGGGTADGSAGSAVNGGSGGSIFIIPGGGTSGASAAGGNAGASIIAPDAAGAGGAADAGAPNGGPLSCPSAACGTPCMTVSGMSGKCSITHQCGELVAACPSDGVGSVAEPCAGKACGESCFDLAGGGVCTPGAQCSHAGLLPPCAYAD
jgi:hypothetical protein